MRSSDDPFRGSDRPSARVLAGRLVGPLLFGVTEAWAVFVVLTQIRVSGVQAAALVLVVSGVLVAMSSEWHEVRSQLRRDSRQSPESVTGPETSEVSDAGHVPAQSLCGKAVTGDDSR